MLDTFAPSESKVTGTDAGSPSVLDIALAMLSEGLWGGGVFVGVTVGVRVGVDVKAGVGVTVGVRVGVGVNMGMNAGGGTPVGARVAAGLGVGGGSGVLVACLVGVGVGRILSWGQMKKIGVGVLVRVGVGVGCLVAVGVGLILGSGQMKSPGGDGVDVGGLIGVSATPSGAGGRGSRAAECAMELSPNAEGKECECLEDGAQTTIQTRTTVAGHRHQA